MTREEAYIWNENSHDENYSTVKEMEESIHYLLKRIYDSFENRSCKNCFYFNSKYQLLDINNSITNRCEKLSLYVTDDFCCNKWESK